jgi:site-specific recombinase XerD
MAHKKARLAESSYKTDQGRLQQLLPIMGTVAANRPDVPMRIQETLAQLKNSGLSNSTVNRFHALISSVFKFAVDAGHIESNPTKKVKRYKENESRIRWLRPDEEKAIRADGLVSDVHEHEFDLALNTGMRRGEQFGLQWKEVDFANKRLIVRGKTGTRPIRLNTAAIAALRKLQAITGKETHVSPDAGADVKRDSRRWFENACKKAGVTDFHWHDLRHTFASRLVMNGSDIVSVKELLGHKDVKMTMKYAHLAPSHLDEAVEKMVQQEARS